MKMKLFNMLKVPLRVHDDISSMLKEEANQDSCCIYIFCITTLLCVLFY